MVDPYFFVKPMIDPKRVEKFSYDVDSARQDGTEIRNVSRLVIYPMEAGNKLDLQTKDGLSLFAAALNIIQSVDTVSRPEGLLKRTNLSVEIKYGDKLGGGSITVDIEDKKVNEFIQVVQNLSQISKDYWSTAECIHNHQNKPAVSKVFYKAPFLAENEEILWMRTFDEGIINRHVKVLYALTNFRAIEYDFKSHECGRVFLSNVDDIVVMNQRRESDSQSSGTYRRTGTYMGTSSGERSTTSRIVGDVVFMADGKSMIQFSHVIDPQGLVRLAKAACDDIKEAKKRFLQRTEGTVSSAIGTAPQALQDQIVCPSCKELIPANANFCNSCGSKVRYVCSKCGHTNTEDSKFCNSCGFALR